MRAWPILLLLLLGYSSFIAAQTYLPDHRRTPGATNPEVRQENIRSTVCARGYTKAIRPPKQVSVRSGPSFPVETATLTMVSTTNGSGHHES